MRGTPFDCSGLFHGTRGEILARTQVKPPESVYECMINLLSESPEDEDVIAVFRGQASINDVRAKMGLEPDVLPYSAQKLYLDPYSYTMELGELLADKIIARMMFSTNSAERDFVVHRRKDLEIQKLKCRPELAM